MDWTFDHYAFSVWIFAALSILILNITNNIQIVDAVPQPGEGLFGGGEMGDLYGGAQMANHVPRLGRRSRNPYLNHNRNAFRFFGETGDRTGSSAAVQHRNLAGLFSGPLFRNFRFHGGSSSDDLMRGLIRSKRIEPKKDKENFENFVKEEVKEDLSDDEYLKKYLLEATMKSVLDKMAQIGETKEMIEKLENFEKYGAGTPGSPLPRFLARYNHPLPAMSPKVKTESSFPASGMYLYNKFSQYRPMHP